MKIKKNEFTTAESFADLKPGEVIRMLRRMFGVDGFRQGMDLYFQRYDGQAVTINDFAAAIFSANNYFLQYLPRMHPDQQHCRGISEGNPQNL